MKNRSMLKRIVGVFIIPVGTLLLMQGISASRGVVLFESVNSYIAFFRAAASVMLTTFALAINLNAGRFDFSIGSVSLFSSVLSATICMDAGFKTGVMLGISLIVGAFLGALSGLVYVLIKLPPIIVSLGVTLFYEGAAYAFTQGYGVSFVSNTELTSFPSVIHYLMIMVITLGILILIFDFTKFGFEYKALLTGQKVSVSTGIKEVQNAVICYTIAGGLMGMVGFIASSNTGTIQMAMNFGSIAVMFTAFLPMFIGSFIGRFCNEKIGYVLGSITTAFLSLMYARLNVSSSVQQIVTAFILVFFLIYLNNEKKLLAIFRLEKRRAR